ncbi:MAG: hypothetical protein KKI09_02295 [Spirochaetes bacterium]|nr:hypothetical protein [Spirochaetota bacterium]
MISREDAMFTIGYEGMMAVVDSKAKARYRKLSTMELAKAGLFRAAFTSILYTQNDAEFTEFAAFYNQAAGTKLATKEEFMRLFGVRPETTRRVLAL